MSQPRTTETVFDVAIVGGGLVGCSLAIALAGQDKRVVLLEANDSKSPEPSWDERCIAINAGSQQILQALGLWESLSASAEPILSTHISEKGRFGATRFSATEAGIRALGYNTPLRAIDQCLWNQLSSGQIQVRRPERVVSVKQRTGDISFRTDRCTEPYHVKLLVAADGARSQLRELMGLEADTRDYEQRAIVTAIRPQFAHGAVAYERFLPGGPLAILPKPRDEQGHACSLVWTLPEAEAAAAMRWDDDQFLARSQEAFGERLGRFQHLGHRSAYPLHRVLAHQTTTQRCVFVGNAAQSLHPVAAQGFNLGLRDAWTLSQTLEVAPDPGADGVLKCFEDLRSKDRAQTAGFTDRLVRLFSNRTPGLQGLRHLGLLLLEFQSPARHQVLHQNLGFKALSGQSRPR